MASSESNTLEEESTDQSVITATAIATTTTVLENMPIETSASSALMQNAQELERENELDENMNMNRTLASHKSASYRGVNLSESSGGDDVEQVDDSWWSEVENNDLILDQVPNVTAVFTSSPEAILEKSISAEESESILKEENFDRLHKIADKIKMTLSEHAKNKEIEEKAERERKLSENSTSDKENKTGNSETDCCTVAASKEQSLEEFREELRSKRLQRQNAVQDLRDEITSLQDQLSLEREINRRLRCGELIEESSLTSTFDASTSAKDACASGEDSESSNHRRHANIELANAQLALQMANSENISLRDELAVVQKQVATLKEVIACCKQMLIVKEEQCNELKERLTEIEKSFAEHETKIMSDNLRLEYERQLVNIRQLRQLYEERQRVAAAEYENLQRLISIKKDELVQEQEKCRNLEERNQNLMKEVEQTNNELSCLRDECKEHKFEKAALKEEIGAVNTLFSQMVMGFNGKNNLDIDRLTTMLEENRTLLNDMATKECTDGATLPKLLFELVEQATSTTTTENTAQDNNKKTCSTHLQSSGSSTHSMKTTIADATKLSEKLRSELVEEEEEANEDNDNVISNIQVLQQHEIMPFQQEEEVVATSSDGNASPVQSEVLALATNNIEEKVTVMAQSKIKKYHRKAATTSNRKSSLSSLAAPEQSSSAAAAAATMQQLYAGEIIGNVSSAQEIAGNLPKVWRVLTELLSHHKIDPVQFEENGKSEDCYKSVETPNGPKAELSVSKTYLKLKDLILEKKSLVKETTRLKTLNSHLDYRLNEQEKRLSAVSLELTKTWHLVGKMQRQHRQLHTQEQILRYQLQQKRRLLSELKEELEYCRRKWAAARAKNDESQEQCNDLRREFARRKLEDANNSAESGYSDSGGPVSDEEASALTDGVGMGAVERDLGENPYDHRNNEDFNNEDATMPVNTAAGGCVNYRRKKLRDMFEHTRKIKRMQSTSPGRAGAVLQPEVVVLRWNSAPPTCGWGGTNGIEEAEIDEVDGLERNESNFNSSPLKRGAIPKAPTRPSRHPQKRVIDHLQSDSKLIGEASPSEDRACRIQRLEQQCRTLIKQVLETSDNRERLEVQLRHFQDEMSPVQHVVPLEELLTKKRNERMTRASSVPVTGSGSLTPREVEYTRKRSERLGRLEEESRQLLSRIKRTSDRGHYLRCSLDRIRRAPPSHEGSFESNTEEDAQKPDEKDACPSNSNRNSQENMKSENLNSEISNNKENPLTAEEEAYTVRRAARLQRLEEESKLLITKLSKNNQRGDTMGTKLDTLHKRFKPQEGPSTRSPLTIQSGASFATPITRKPGKMSVEQRIENIEKISSNREERLRILEEEGRQLINKLSVTSEKGTIMINRITERELNRQKRSSSIPVKDSSFPDNKTSSSAKVLNAKSTSEETPVAAALLPTPKTVACSSIVSEEINERVTITTIPSQIAAHQGAIPKSKPSSQLLASRPKSARLQKTVNKALDNANESLEEMIKRLQSVPFPDTQEETKENEKKNQGDFEASNVKEDIENSEDNSKGQESHATDQLNESGNSFPAETSTILIKDDQEDLKSHTPNAE